MDQLDNRTPFAAVGGWIRDRGGAEVWLMALKCTFDILPDGTTEISEEQPPATRVPEYNGDPGMSSLRLESDLVLTKTTTDVTVIGHAFAPGGNPITKMAAGLRVGSIQKVVHVYGDRVWETLGPSPPDSFLKIPLMYERAYGGVDTRSAHPEKDWDVRNPVGMGFAASRDHAKGAAVPNFEYPNETLSNWSDRPRPAGFGPIGSHWQRVRFAGTYDERWMQTRLPLLPDDFDDRFYQAVPADQQTAAFLQGGEPVDLRGLTASGDLRFSLPRVEPRFVTRFIDGSREVHPVGKLHSVIVETDRPRVSLVWHSALPCHVKVNKLERTTITVKTAA